MRSNLISMEKLKNAKKLWTWLHGSLDMNVQKSGHEHTKVGIWTHLSLNVNYFFSSFVKAIISIKWFIALPLKSSHSSGSFQGWKKKFHLLKEVPKWQMRKKSISKRALFCFEVRQSKFKLQTKEKNWQNRIKCQCHPPLADHNYFF